jgi:prepilin-type N-terminal cleavage/methylation domain-containing protein
MRRSGFTMVELIFVIIIIGILSVAAIPKFGDIKDRAKINAEYSSLSGLDAAIIAKIEFAREDNGDDNASVLWHGEVASTSSSSADYNKTNNTKKVLSSIVKKGDNLKIIGYIDGQNDGTISSGDSLTTFDLLMIEGAASNSISGVKQIKTNEDKTEGRPDKNDFWVFNPMPIDVNISSSSYGVTNTFVPSGELVLIDVNETVADITNINATPTGGSAQAFIAP